VNETVLSQAAARSRADRIFLSAVARLPGSRSMRAILLAWLWMRFWPMNPLLVLRSAIWRYFARASS
jgi:hypothetical protein